MKDNKDDISKKGVKKDDFVDSFGKVPEDFYQNQLAVDQDILDEAKARGLEVRWINKTKYETSGNIHQSWWKPWSPKALGSKSDHAFGRDVNGYIIRGDSILAARPVQHGDVHRKKLEEKANRYKGFNKEKANELKELAKQSGVDSFVEEGYGDDED